MTENYAHALTSVNSILVPTLRTLGILVLFIFASQSELVAESSLEQADNSLSTKIVKAVNKLAETLSANGISAIKTQEPSCAGEDTYIFVIHSSGEVVYHGSLKALEGKDYSSFEQSDGKRPFKIMLELARKSEGGWLTYTWLERSSLGAKEKRTYVQSAKHQGELFIIGCGTHQPLSAS